MEDKEMISSSNQRKRWLTVALVIAIALISVTGLFLWRGSKKSPVAGQPVPEPTDETSAAPAGGTSGKTSLRPEDIIISLPQEMIENAGIKTDVVAQAQTTSSSPVAEGLRTAGTVESNQYKEVPIAAIAGGVAREVSASLGERVTKGQKLAKIFSTELSDATAEYFKMRAEIDKHHQHYKRTEELVEIGAASKEELEVATADYKKEEASFATIRQRLILLGANLGQLDEMQSMDKLKPLISVEAPSSGIILSRSVNSGEVVAAGKELFRVADLSNVWVIGQIYESDFASVHVGTPAVITAPAYPGKVFKGRVSYIDPRVEPQMRTSQVRIEVQNPGEMLRLGMFVDVTFGGAVQTTSSGQPLITVPRVAVQTIGAKQFVFLATEQPGIFAQREITTGPEANGVVPIYSGLTAGERIVTEGSFLLRAESLKVNPSQISAQTTQAAAQVPQPEQTLANGPATKKESEPKKAQSVTVTLNESGYRPASFKLKKGIPARLTFIRQVEATCGTEILLPDYDIKRDLPLNEPVVVEFTPTKTGTLTFHCGMDMLRGKIVVR